MDIGPDLEIIRATDLEKRVDEIKARLRAERSEDAMQTTTFQCVKCRKNKPKIKGRQPVSTLAGKFCAYCWAAGVWGKSWAEQCKQPGDE